MFCGSSPGACSSKWTIRCVMTRSCRFPGPQWRAAVHRGVQPPGDVRVELALIPGSVNNGGGIYQSTGSNYSVSGNRSEQNDYTLDGVSNNEEFFKAYGIQPAIDSIQEFQVRTNITSAEFGEAAGANVAVATKSGTNQIHGSAYEFVRNDKFDAAEFFDDRAGISKTPCQGKVEMS